MLDQFTNGSFAFPGLTSNAVASAVTILLLWLARRVTLMVVRRRVTDNTTLYHWSKYSAYTVTALGVVLIGNFWFVGFGNLTTFFGLLSAGLAIALKDLVASLAGWLFIIWRRPFELGDRIEIGTHRGDVIDIRLFKFTLMEIGNWVDADQSTGRVIHLPNSSVLTDAISSYNKGFRYIWNELPVLVTFESDWKKAKEMFTQIVKEHAIHITPEASRGVRLASERFLIRYDNLTPIVYTSVADSGVMLTARYLCEPKKRRSTAEMIWEEILQKLAECDDIDLAYPTTRYYNNIHEGKPGAGGKPG